MLAKPATARDDAGSYTGLAWTPLWRKDPELTVILKEGEKFESSITATKAIVDPKAEAALFVNGNQVARFFITIHSPE